MSFICKAVISQFSHLRLTGINVCTFITKPVNLPKFSYKFSRPKLSRNKLEKTHESRLNIGREIPKDYQMVYKYPKPYIVHAVPYISFGLVLCNSLLLFSLMENKEKPVDEGMIGSEYNKPPELYSSIAAVTVTSMYIILMLLSAKRIVLASFKRDSEYISTFVKYFSFSVKYVRHIKKDCVFYPEHKIFKFELNNKKVIMYEEYFFDKYDLDQMCTVKTEEK